MEESLLDAIYKLDEVDNTNQLDDVYANILETMFKKELKELEDSGLLNLEREIENAD